MHCEEDKPVKIIWIIGKLCPFKFRAFSFSQKQGLEKQETKISLQEGGCFCDSRKDLYYCEELYTDIYTYTPAPSIILAVGKC